MSAAKKLVMEPERQVPAEAWAELTTQLVKTARAQGLSREDAEDRAQDALLRLAGERPRPNAPPIQVRAGRPLQLAVIDEARRRLRQKEVPRATMIELDAEELREVAVEDDLVRRLRFMEVVNAVRDTVGHDAVKLLMEGEAGYTEAESDSRRAANAPTTGALRKRISRAIPDIAERITDLKKESDDFSSRHA